MKPLVSIIIPTYNRQELILRALKSVKEQSYRPIEIIVVNDGSTDNTLTVIDNWLKQNSEQNMSLLTLSKSNGGPSSSRNMGLQYTNGKYIYFLDSDDYMHNNLLEITIQILENENSDCILFGFDYLGSGGKKSFYLPPTEPVLKSFLNGQLWGYTYSSIKRSDLIKNVGLWNETITVAEDYEYLGRTLFHSQKTVVVCEPLITVSIGSSDSLTSQKNTQMGLKHRLIAESSIIDLLQKQKNNIPHCWLESYSHRLLKTSINYYAKGEVSFASQMKILALELGVKSQHLQHKLTRYACNKGLWSSRLWYALTRFYSLSRKIQKKLSS